MARDMKRNLATIREFGSTNDEPFNQEVELFPTNIDLVCSRGITISGSVKDTDGAPVTNATVAISMLSNR